MDILKRRLEDEKRMFNEMDLTEKERKVNRINEEIYQLALKQRSKTQDINTYRMPEDYDDMEDKNKRSKKHEVLYARYEV